MRENVLQVCKTKLGLSFLLAIALWVFLTACWNLTNVGSPAFRFIAAVVRPGWNAGHYFAAILFGNDLQHRAAAAFMGLAGELVTYTAFWSAVIIVIGRMRSNKRCGSISD